MNGIGDLGKFIIIAGFILVGLGFLLLFFEKIPYIGKLPGDIIIRKKNFTFYFPLMTGLILSLILTLIFYIIGRLR
ncbi:MAG: DUF2905 domain-containing protein [Thermodesulfovibrionales bacterium]|nr:DUF2905 domain-containing protein [Thermodesulfovibrionales bacterium]